MSRTAGFLAAVLAACGGGNVPDDLVGSIEIVESQLVGSRSASVWARFAARDSYADAANDGLCRVYACPGTWGGCEVSRGYSAGRITVTGLAVPLTLELDDQYDAYYTPAVPADLFADDATITASADGDDTGGFTLTTGGVAPLVSSLATLNDAVFRGEPTTLTWTPVAGDARVRVALAMAEVCHGASSATRSSARGPTPGRSRSRRRSPLRSRRGSIRAAARSCVIARRGRQPPARTSSWSSAAGSCFREA